MKIEDIILSEISIHKDYGYSICIKLIEAERMVVVHGWGRGEMGNCLRGMEVQFCKMKKF